MRRSVPSPHPCPIHSLLELLTRPWTLHILWMLSTNGPARFGVLQKQVDGISSRVLAERLRGLERKGFVFRHYEPTIPPSVTYGITPRMKDIEKGAARTGASRQKMESGRTARRPPGGCEPLTQARIRITDGHGCESRVGRRDP